MRAAVVGMGVVSPYGEGADLFWEQTLAGACALRPVTRFDAAAYRNTLGGEVPPLAGPAVAEDAGSLATEYAARAAREAVRNAGWAAGADALLILGTNFGAMGAAEQAFRRRKAGAAAVSLAGFPPGEALATVRRAAGLGAGADVVVSLSCASGVGALGTALERLRAGDAPRALAGGFDELSETAFAGLSALRAISRDTIRPFDKGRDGAIFSEGAALFALEREDAFFHRCGADARPLAWLAGRGLSNDAHHMTAPETTGAGVALAMRMALADAGVPPDAVGHVNLHGTGTPYNDKIETLALRTVFGDGVGRVVCTANKSLFGHAMGAAGGLEAVATVMTLRTGRVPPTLGCRERDPELELDVIMDNAREVDITVAMKNSYGLGGANAVAVFVKA